MSNLAQTVAPTVPKSGTLRHLAIGTVAAGAAMLWLLTMMPAAEGANHECTFGPDGATAPSPCPYLINTNAAGTVSPCGGGAPCGVNQGDIISILDKDLLVFEHDDEVPNDWAPPCKPYSSKVSNTWAGAGELPQANEWQWCFHELEITRDGQPYIQECVTRNMENPTTGGDYVVSLGGATPSTLPSFAVQATTYEYQWSKATSLADHPSLWGACYTQPLDQEGMMLAIPCENCHPCDTPTIGIEGACIEPCADMLHEPGLQVNGNPSCHSIPLCSHPLDWAQGISVGVTSPAPACIAPCPGPVGNLGIVINGQPTCDSPFCSNPQDWLSPEADMGVDWPIGLCFDRPPPTTIEPCTEALVPLGVGVYWDGSQVLCL